MTFSEEFLGVRLNPIGVRWKRGKSGHATRLCTVSFQVQDVPYEALQRLADAAIGRQEVSIRVSFPQAAMDMTEASKEQGALPLGEAKADDGGQGLQGGTSAPPPRAEDVAAHEAVADPLKEKVKALAEQVVRAGKDKAALTSITQAMEALGRGYAETDITYLVGVEYMALLPAGEDDDMIVGGMGELHPGMFAVPSVRQSGVVRYIHPTWAINFTGKTTPAVSWVQSDGKRSVRIPIAAKDMERLKRAIAMAYEAVLRAECSCADCQAHPQPHRHRNEDGACLWDADRAWREVKEAFGETA
ncbi:MAG: hypothetical protein Q8P59_09970 [Dehalococcoidia bacterium]|nr:hypothetical protein [Dehalococcoidia bacterium]